jgi:hypothetical protein
MILQPTEDETSHVVVTGQNPLKLTILYNDSQHNIHAFRCGANKHGLEVPFLLPTFLMSHFVVTKNLLLPAFLMSHCSDKKKFKCSVILTMPCIKMTNVGINANHSW